jgi:K+-transporting ATPase ATPase B chain
VRITSKPGESFIDRMIALVEGASRQKTPNEIALNILLAALTIIFLIALVTLQPFAIYSGAEQKIVVLVALLVCLIPTTIGALLSAIGIAGMDRLIQRNVMAMSGRAVEAAGDVDVILLDKTGNITYGNRRASAFHPLSGVDEGKLVEAALLSSLADETPEGRSIVDLARDLGCATSEPKDAQLIPFTAQTRMSGVDFDAADGQVRSIRKGAADSVKRYAEAEGGEVPSDLDPIVEQLSREGKTPLVVVEGKALLGVIELKDTVKPGMRERFDQMRAMGIRTVMITGDNPLTAASIAAEAASTTSWPRQPRKTRWTASAPSRRRQPRRDDRRRHERARGARARRRRRRDEHRHPGGQRGGEHGRPRLRPHEADRSRRDRQAAAHHAAPSPRSRSRRRREVLPSSRRCSPASPASACSTT